MNTTTIISIFSLVVAFLALPTSYFIAVRQVKIGFIENERRTKKRLRVLVADKIDEFFSIFYSTCWRVVEVEPEKLRRTPEIIDPYIKEIDAIIRKTLVLDRLANAIDRLFLADSIDESEEENEIKRILQSIRSLIALGTDASGYVTLNVIAAYGGINIQSILRKE